MYIYEIMESRQVDEDIEFYSEHVVHENKYSAQEFENICIEAKKRINGKNVLELKEYLIENYGFKELAVLQRVYLGEE